MYSFRTTYTSVAFGLALLAFTASADAKLVRTPEKADVKFLATGPGGLKIEGKTNVLNVIDDGQLVKIFVPLNTLDTGIDLRNRHMKERYLQVDRYPNAELQVTRAALKFPSPQAATNAKAQGTLTIHGVSRPATFQYTATADGAAFDVKGTVRVNMKDFNIEQPSYLGVSVKPDVDIDVHFRATDG